VLDDLKIQVPKLSFATRGVSFHQDAGYLIILAQEVNKTSSPQRTTLELWIKRVFRVNLLAWVFYEISSKTRDI
jgi:hypothetical protein